MKATHYLASIAMSLLASPVLAGLQSGGALGNLLSSSAPSPGPIAVPALAIAGGVALVSGIRCIRRKRTPE